MEISCAWLAVAPVFHESAACPSSSLTTEAESGAHDMGKQWPRWAAEGGREGGEEPGLDLMSQGVFLHTTPRKKPTQTSAPNRERQGMTSLLAVMMGWRT